MRVTQLAAIVVLLLVLGVVPLRAEDEGGGGPEDSAQVAAAKAVLGKFWEAMEKGQPTSLKECLAEKLLVVGAAEGESPHPSFVDRAEILKELEEAAGEPTDFADVRPIQVTGQQGPGDIVMVTFRLELTGADDEEQVAPGPYWALIGKIEGQWRIMVFTIPL